MNKKEIDKLYYETHKEKILPILRKYREQHKKERKEYIEKNREKIKNQRRMYYLKNKCKELQRTRQYLNSFVTPTLSAGIVPVEEVRKVDELLQVKCTYCGKWFNPTYSEIQSRYKAIIGKVEGECRFYCSNECKKSCPIFWKREWSEGKRKYLTREVQPELRKLVFERDNYTCRKCGSQESLHCHHVEGIRWNPIESADIDQCITYCKNCHEEVHLIEGCMYYEMKCLPEIVNVRQPC